MRTLIACSLLLLSGCSTICPNNYLQVGAGLQKATQVYGGKYENSPISARIEIGKECDDIRVGISHHSQWLIGFPFDNAKENSKTEIFADYIIRF